MTHIIIVGEGQTEETFVRDVLVAPFAEQGKYLNCRLIWTSESAKGGALMPDRVIKYLRNTLRERSDTYVTTFFDLYRLDPKFPGHAQARNIQDPIARAKEIERCLAEEVVKAAGCRADRFFPHIQPHEFEALLFSRPEALVELHAEWRPRLELLRKIRDSFPTPEHINHKECPADRLKELPVPKYKKVVDGPRAVQAIGLARIRAECLHFGEWLTRIEALPPL